MIGGDGRPQVSERAILTILVIAAMSGPMALNIVMPVLPLLEQTFATTRERVTLVLSCFLLGMAISQLVIGPFADRFGRRPVMLLGFALFVVASIAAMFATTIEQIIAARICQALGATVGLPLARTIVRDLFDRERSASMIGYVTMGMVIAPMISPFIGALAAGPFGWQAIFLLCAVFGLAACVTVHYHLPETRPRSLDDTTARDVARRSMALLRRVPFLAYAGTTAFCSAMFFSFQAGTPFLVIDIMGWDKSAYALWFILGALGYFSGNFMSGRYAARLGPSRMITLGNWGGLFGAALLLVLALLNVMHPLALFVPMMFVAFANGLVMPSAIAGAVSVDTQAAGAASGLVGFLQSSCAATASFVVGSIVTTTAMPLGIAMILFATLSLVCGWIAERAASAENGA